MQSASLVVVIGRGKGNHRCSAPGLCGTASGRAAPVCAAWGLCAPTHRQRREDCCTSRTASLMPRSVRLNATLGGGRHLRCFSFRLHPSSLLPSRTRYVVAALAGGAPPQQRFPSLLAHMNCFIMLRQCSRERMHLPGRLRSQAAHPACIIFRRQTVLHAFGGGPPPSHKRMHELSALLALPFCCDDL